MLRGLILIALAAVSWGTTGSVTTVLVATANAEPLLIGAARTVVAAALLLIGARVVAGGLTVARADRGRCVAAGVGMAVFQVAYFTAVTLSGIAAAALVAICTAPLMIAALAALFLGERVTGRVAAALFLGVAGTALLVAGPTEGAPPARFAGGVLLALVAGLAYALYAVLTKASLARSAPLPLTAATFAVAAACLVPALAWTERPLTQVALGWPWLLYLGAVTTAGAYALYAAGLRMVPAAVAGVVTLLEPLTATLLAVLVFGERLGLTGAIGAALLLSAIALLSRRP
ncbi:MAG TPA: EamA family transporter [Methylomirabilota bacterium]|nr:EamA family transporter [Methylomirabilota bacterium]